MIMGIRGSGANTQLLRLNAQYNIPIFRMKELFLAKIREEKEKRKKQRILDRGFKP